MLTFGRTNQAGDKMLEYPLDLRTAYPDTGLPPEPGAHNITAEMLAEGVVAVEHPAPPVVAHAGVTAGPPERVGGQWKLTWITAPIAIEQRRALVSRQIDMHAKGLRDNVVALISAAEMSSWSIKQQQAEAFVASGLESDAPMLVKEAGFRKCSTAELVGMVLAKAEQLSDLEAMISGECGRRQDLLRVAELAQIDALAGSVRTGWPGFPDPAQ